MERSSSKDGTNSKVRKITFNGKIFNIPDHGGRKSSDTKGKEPEIIEDANSENLSTSNSDISLNPSQKALFLKEVKNYESLKDEEKPKIQKNALWVLFLSFVLILAFIRKDFVIQNNGVLSFCVILLAQGGLMANKLHNLVLSIAKKTKYTANIELLNKLIEVMGESSLTEASEETLKPEEETVGGGLGT